MKYFSELNNRLGKKIRDNVLIDLKRGDSIRPSKLETTTAFVATLISLTPYFICSIGAAIILSNWESVPAIAIGCIILAGGLYLRPRSFKNTQTTLRRADAPTLFSLLDNIANHLKSPPIDGVHVDSNFNAYMAEFKGKDRVLGIGAPLWLALDPPERLALLAHEVAHLINNDPARGKIASNALETLARWHDLIHPPTLINHEHNTRFYYENRGLIGQLFSYLLGGVISTIALGFEKLIFAESQRSEYLADIASSSIAGAAAEKSSLKKIILSPLAEYALKHAHYDGSKDINLFENMARAVRSPDTHKAAELYTEADKSMHTIDSSHPPTRYRMEVVAIAGNLEPAIDTDQVDWAAIDEEFAPHFQREEQALLSKIIIQ